METPQSIHRLSLAYDKLLLENAELKEENRSLEVQFDALKEIYEIRKLLYNNPCEAH